MKHCYLEGSRYTKDENIAHLKIYRQVSMKGLGSVNEGELW